MRSKAFAAASLVLMLAGSIKAVEVPSGTLQSRVAAAVYRDLGFDATQPGVELKLQGLTSEFRLPREADLHVSTAKRVGTSNSLIAKMECESRLDCMPFQVLVLCQPGVSLKTKSHDTRILTEPFVPKISGQGDQRVAPLVRAGQRVRVGEEISGMHLSASGMCLQAGGMGQTIRVRNVASGRVLLARVLGAGSVVVEER